MSNSFPPKGPELGAKSPEWRRCGARLWAPAAAGIAALCLFALPAAAEVLSSGSLVAFFNGTISPSKLSKSTPLPIAMHLDGSFKTTDGSQLPDLKTVSVQFNRHALIDSKGLSTCTVAKLKSTLVAQAKQTCGGAFVGAGKISAEITLPEEAPFDSTGPLMVFLASGKKHGQLGLLMYVQANAPILSTYVTEITVTEQASGALLTAYLPQIDGNYGHISSFDISLGRRFRLQGKEQSFLSATCPAPAGLPATSFPFFAQASYGFSNGSTIKGPVFSRCEVRSH